MTKSKKFMLKSCLNCFYVVKGPEGCSGELIVNPGVDGVIIVSGVVISRGKKVLTFHEIFTKQNWKPLLHIKRG